MSKQTEHVHCSICFEFVERTKFHEKLVRHCRHQRQQCRSNVGLYRKNRSTCRIRQCCWCGRGFAGDVATYHGRTFQVDSASTVVSSHCDVGSRRRTNEELERSMHCDRDETMRVREAAGAMQTDRQTDAMNTTPRLMTVNAVAQRCFETQVTAWRSGNVVGLNQQG